MISEDGAESERPELDEVRARCAGLPRLEVERAERCVRRALSLRAPVNFSRSFTVGVTDKAMSVVFDLDPFTPPVTLAEVRAVAAAADGADVRLRARGTRREGPFSANPLQMLVRLPRDGEA